MKQLCLLVVIIFVSLEIHAQNAIQSPNKDSFVTIRTICTTHVSKNNLPLYVVDGIIRDSGYIKMLDTKLIESIKVLSGDKAKAAYGSDGINGVIIITTKRDLLLSDN